MFALKIITLSSRPITRTTWLRCLTQMSIEYKENLVEKMQTWQVHSYGGINDLKLSTVRIPAILRPTDVLIKVEASSVNPIDVSMTRGYGAAVLKLMRNGKICTSGIAVSDIEFPLTMGRDFAGVVISKGHNIGERLKLGDQVWGVVPVEQQGCHAHYVIVDSNLVNPCPQNLSYIEASCILYAGLTAWSALWLTGGLCYKTTMVTRLNKRILVLGGSGGVGTLAIQLLKAWNMHVITTCSKDATEVLERLGADVVIDYKEEKADSKVFSEGPYDIILDCSNQGPECIKAKGYPHCTYITLNSPLLTNIDRYGLIGGAVKNIQDLLKHNIPKIENKSWVKWGFFTPSRTGINVLQDLVASGKVIPVIERVYPFNELPKAYERVAQGHLRGKLVIDMK